jgi:hypothetical protein
MLDTLEYLLPAIPQTLYAGLGKPKIERLIALRSQAEQTWNRYPTEITAFPEFWLETLGQFDADPESFDLEQIQDELLERMTRLLGQSYRMLALELGDTQRVIRAPGVVVMPPENNPLPSVDEPATEPPPSEPHTKQAETRKQIETEREEQLTLPETNAVSAISTPSRVQQIRGQIDRATATEPAQTVETCPINDIWIIGPTLDTPEQLRLAIAGLAREMAVYAGHPESIIDQTHGLGFALNIEQLDLAAPRAAGVHLMLLALLRAQDDVSWEDRKQLPSALFGQLLLGVYQLPLIDRPTMDVGLERLPDDLLIKLYRLVRLARRLIDLTLTHEADSPKELP